MNNRLVCLAAIALAFMGGVQEAVARAAAGSATMVSAEDFVADVKAMRAFIAATHPQLDYTTDVAKLDAAEAKIVGEVKKPISRKEAWKRLAVFNSIFSDGHLSITVPDWRERAAAYLAHGGGYFPFEVWVDPDGKTRIVSALGGGETPLKGTRITSINGVPVRTISAQFLARAHGDTPVFRAALLSRRFWWFYREMYGEPKHFEIGLANRTGTVEVHASSATPVALRHLTFDGNFQFELKPHHAAVLTIRSFYWKDKARYYAFMKHAFVRIKQAKVTTLVIDIRDNGGGDDDMWMHGILDYIADKPYRWGSTYKKRILEKYRDAGEVVGSVKAGEIETIIQPHLDNPLAYRGKTYVLIGPYTYSSAILFTNVVEDYGFATVAGTGGAAKRGQTGSIQSIILPHTGLELTCPRFYLIPPSGGQGKALVEPEISLKYDPLDPEMAVRALLGR